MKIGITGFVLDDGRSGIGTYFTNLIAGLQGADSLNRYELHLAPGENLIVPVTSPNFHKRISSSIFTPPLLNVGWHHTALPLIAAREKYDLLHIPSIRRVPYLKPCRLIATVHDLAPLVVSGKYDPLRMFYHKHILSKMVHRCDHLIAVSYNTKQDLINYHGYPEEKITVIYSGVEEALFDSVDRKYALDSLKNKYQLADPFFVYVSRIEHPGKNHINLIKGFESFKRKNKTNHQLVLVGSDWSGAEKVREFAAKSPYVKDIRFVGFVPREDIISFYAACELMIYPSLYEGFGLPVIEAMAVGAPVICSNSSSLKEIGESAALLFDPLEPDDISDCLDRAITPEMRKEMIKNGKDKAKKFRWKKTATEVLETYRRVAQC